MLRAARRTSRASARAGRGCATSTAPTTRRRAPIPCDPGRDRPRRCSGCGGRRTRSPRRYRQLDADPTRAASRRLGVGRGDLAAARRARRRRRLGRALLHVHRGHRPVLAAAARRVGGRVRAVGARSCTCRARARRAGRTGCCSSTTARPGDSAQVRFTGAARRAAAVGRGLLLAPRGAWRWPSTRGGRPALDGPMPGWHAPAELASPP